MLVRLTQIDGKLPNLALMKLAHWHKSRGDEVRFVSNLEKGYREPEYDVVYGSAIFAYSADRLSRFRAYWPNAIVGGTGSGSPQTIEDLIGSDYEHYDYAGYPNFKASIGFTQRGCRLSCKFCVVPKKEGKNRSINTIHNIWRGEGHPKKLHLLDNDFFGQEFWRERVDEIIEGEFKVCLNQGINVRLIHDEGAAALAHIQYRDDSFSERRLYTAWDNIGDEAIFFRGIDTLERAGVPAKHVMAYMLIGYDPKETTERIFYRFQKMVDRGILPYPMVYDRSKKELREFQRWVITGLYRAIPFSEYKVSYKSKPPSNLITTNLFHIFPEGPA